MISIINVVINNEVSGRETRARGFLFSTKILFLVLLISGLLHKQADAMKINCSSIISEHQQIPSPTDIFKYKIRGSLDDKDLRCEGLVVQRTATTPQIRVVGIETSKLRLAVKDEQNLWFKLKNSYASKPARLAIMSNVENYRLDYALKETSSVFWPVEKTLKNISNIPDDLRAVAWKTIEDTPVYTSIEISKKPILAINKNKSMDIELRYGGFAKKVRAYIGRYKKPSECSGYIPKLNQSWSNITPSTSMLMKIQESTLGSFCVYFAITLKRDGRSKIDDTTLFFSK